jgi:hypothetical protein
VHCQRNSKIITRNAKHPVTEITVSHLWGAVQHCHRNSRKNAAVSVERASLFQGNRRNDSRRRGLLTDDRTDSGYDESGTRARSRLGTGQASHRGRTPVGLVSIYEAARNHGRHLERHGLCYAANGEFTAIGVTSGNASPTSGGHWFARYRSTPSR